MPVNQIIVTIKFKTVFKKHPFTQPANLYKGRFVIIPNRHIKTVKTKRESSLMGALTLHMSSAQPISNAMPEPYNIPCQ
jgi:hypothetical protein